MPPLHLQLMSLSSCKYVALILMRSTYELLCSVACGVLVLSCASTLSKVDPDPASAAVAVAAAPANTSACVAACAASAANVAGGSYGSAAGATAPCRHCAEPACVPS